ncbi:hypothetical protein O181_022692 [Austropuccinia psidii MF-1]|uniref:Uncharacterized protein n=1 Tax=Austropuccinia psidii MF-1 TaxID=1389203 RepID=A0A9Q3CFZ7_9BASI|nr:hypothetical protein [Austropuccinia psidii MF-1]
MEDSRTSTSSQRLSRTFDTLLESPEAEITAIPVVRSEQCSTGSIGNIPFSVQELVYGGKAAGVGTSAKHIDRENELLYSIKEGFGPRKEIGTSERLDTHVLQRTSPKYKSFIVKPKHFFKDQKKELAQKKENSPVEAPQALKRKNKPQKAPNKGKKATQRNQKGKYQMEQA